MLTPATTGSPRRRARFERGKGLSAASTCVWLPLSISIGFYAPTPRARAMFGLSAHRQWRHVSGCCLPLSDWLMGALSVAPQSGRPHSGGRPDRAPGSLVKDTGCKRQDAHTQLVWAAKKSRKHDKAL